MTVFVRKLEGKNCDEDLGTRRPSSEMVTNQSKIFGSDPLKDFKVGAVI